MTDTQNPTQPADDRTRSRGSLAFSFAAALLNLTGLGLGYLYTRARIRWLIHFLITVGLLVAAYFTNATAAPLFVLVIAGLWLTWMALDGWRCARRPAQAVPVPTPRWWSLVLIAVLLLGLEAAGIWGYITLGQQEYIAGATAYRMGDCRTAVGHFSRATTLYRLALGPTIFTADDELAACSLLVQADDALEQGDYAEATAGYETYLARYPAGPLLIPTREEAAKAYSEWAADLEAGGDYAEAVEKYQVVLSDYPHTEAGKTAAEQVARTYMAWGDALQEAEAYDEAVAKYLIVLNEYPDTSAAEEAPGHLAVAYMGWAAALRQEARYAEAIARYQAALDQGPSTEVGREITEAMAEAYAEWGDALREEGSYEEAIERYETVLNDYRATAAARRIRPAVAEAYVLWADQASKEGKFEDAAARYQVVLDRYASLPVAAEAREGAAAALVGWAAQLSEEGKFTAAMEKFTQAQELTDNPDVTAAAEEGYNQALWGLSQDSTGEGREVLQQALEEVCAGHPASSPAVGLAEEEPGKALVCGGSDLNLPAELRAAKPGHFRYVVSVEEGASTVERCDYTHLGCTGWFCPTTNVLVRQREWWRVRVRDTRTARVVADRTFYGPYPRACQQTETFSGYEKYVTGGPPSTSDVLGWLSGVVR